MSGLSDEVLGHLRTAIDEPDLGDAPYELLEPLGAGGMGVVYRARDRRLGREVALKVLRAGAAPVEMSDRLLREARITAGLEHPGIAPIHDVGRLPDGRCFYVMKLIRGRRLDEWVTPDTPLAERLRVFQRICETVAFAHDRGALHRDLKPQNVMLGEYGEVLVLDWGVARWTGAARDTADASDAAGASPADSGGEMPPASEAETVTRGTRPGAMLGTPAYMSPEAARGEVDAISQRSDVYGLGALLYDLLTGRAPIGATQLAEMRTGSAPRITRPGRLARVPRRLEAICLRALAFDPTGRYATAGELRADISAFLADQPVAAYRETPWERGWRTLVRYRVPVLIVLTYVAARIVVALWQRTGGGR